ncbi:MAG TPA: nucleotidyltransferase domain-containing protein [Thermoanaerobaculia bacterium]|nr:nucleotidyltransferase domain-containing protein [Thermoanaerobaculia bacterium]
MNEQPPHSASVDIDLLRREIPPRLRATFASRYRGAILFGSRARGDASEESDIDLLVLLDDPVQLGPDGDAIIHALYPLQLDIGVPIHALPARHNSYEAGTYALYRHAQEEGVLL